MSCEPAGNAKMVNINYFVYSVSRELPSVEEVAKSVDVDSLETAFSSMGPKYMKKVGKAEPSPGP